VTRYLDVDSVTSVLGKFAGPDLRDASVQASFIAFKKPNKIHQ